MTAALLTALPMLARAQTPTWTTVEDYQLAAGASSVGRCMTADAMGNVFTGGFGDPGSGLPSGLVLGTTDTSEVVGSWSVVDDFNPGSPAQAAVTGLAFDSNGNLWSVGTVYNICTKTSCSGYWYIHMSPTPTMPGSWIAMSTFQYAPGQVSVSSSIAADGSGNVFVVGHPSDANGVEHWVVRKYSIANKDGVTVDDITDAGCRGVAFVPNVGLIATGGITTTTKGTTTTSWVVRKSLDGSAGSWSTVDVIAPPAGYTAMARAVTSDINGNIYVVGETYSLVTVSKHSSSVIEKWLVRQISPGATTWTTVDAFSYPTGMAAIAYGIGRDSFGNPVVAGTGEDSTGAWHWVVRRPVQGAWQTVDDYQLAPGQPAAAGGGWEDCVTADAAGNVLVTGSAVDASGVEHWIVRRTNTNP
jgi:hypothetical protein